MSATDRASGGLSALVPKSGVIEVDPKLCLTCRECEVACSLAHEGECAPALSRIQIDFDDFQPGFPQLRVCKQCLYPACLYACEAHYPKDPPLKVDPSTGARYIDPAKCTGCSACLGACPLSPEHPVLFPKRTGVGKRQVLLKCDLCKDRSEGPLCVRVCPGGALQYVSVSTRRA